MPRGIRSTTASTPLTMPTNRLLSTSVFVAVISIVLLACLVGFLAVLAPWLRGQASPSYEEVRAKSVASLSPVVPPSIRSYLPHDAFDIRLALDTDSQEVRAVFSYNSAGTSSYSTVLASDQTARDFFALPAPGLAWWPNEELADPQLEVFVVQGEYKAALARDPRRRVAYLYLVFQ